MNRHKLLLASALLLLGAALIGCSSQPSSEAPQTSAEASTVESLVPLDSEGSGRLDGVGVVAGGPLGISPGSPDDRASALYRSYVDVRVPYPLRGVDTYLAVPMWYGDETVYVVEGDSQETSLVAAVADESVIWWSGQGAKVRYHFVDGYFVLDRLEVARAH